MKVKQVIKGVVVGTIIGTVIVPLEISIGITKIVLAPFAPLTCGVLGGVYMAIKKDN